jgi:ferritin-like protein
VAVMLLPSPRTKNNTALASPNCCPTYTARNQLSQLRPVPMNRIGLEGEGLKEITEDARIEDRNHFEALVPRIYELGGSLPKSMIDFHNVSACPPAFVPADPRNIRDMLQVLVEAERCAVRGYTEICNMTFGKDHRTYDLSLAILHEEIEHEGGFSEFIGEGPSGHALRKSGENSPYVGKFLGAR